MTPRMTEACMCEDSVWDLIFDVSIRHAFKNLELRLSKRIAFACIANMSAYEMLLVMAQTPQSNILCKQQCQP